jgi:hypothetical protein
MTTIWVKLLVDPSGMNLRTSSFWGGAAGDVWEAEEASEEDGAEPLEADSEEADGEPAAPSPVPPASPPAGGATEELEAEVEVPVAPEEVSPGPEDSPEQAAKRNKPIMRIRDKFAMERRGERLFERLFGKLILKLQVRYRTP